MNRVGTTATVYESEPEILATLGGLVRSCVDLDHAVPSLIRVATSVMQSDASFVILSKANESNSDFYFDSASETGQSLGALLAELKERLGRWIDKSRPSVVRDVTDDPCYSKRADELVGFPVRSLASTPLRIGGQTLGMMGVLSAKVGTFEERDLERLGAVAGALAWVIYNAESMGQIRALYEKLTEVNRLKGEFLATVVHELRTPVNIVIGNLDLLLGGFLGELNSRQIASLKTAMRNSGDALNLVSSLLDLSRLEAGQLVIRVEEFLLDDVWNELEFLFRIGLSGKDIRLTWESKGPLPSLKTDKVKIKGILSNIVFNAIKFTDRGEIQVCATPMRGGEAVELEVRDTGVGIPPEFLPSIFEPFRQVETSLTRSQGGAGLGLSIAKKLTDLLHGRIEVESEVGQGSVFRITLPARYAA